VFLYNNILYFTIDDNGRVSLMAETYPLNLLLKYKSNSVTSHKKHVTCILWFAHKGKNLVFPTRIFVKAGTGGMTVPKFTTTADRPARFNTICRRYCINKQKKKISWFFF